MEYLGHTQTATYMTGPRLGGSNAQTFLPSISTMQASYKANDTYPAPSPLRRSLTTLPWRPSTYYQTARVAPSSALVRSMPDPFSARNQLSELDNVKVPSVFAAARNAMYTRFSPNDWANSNQSNYLASDKTRSTAERLRFDTVRLCRETDDKTKRTQSDVGKRLGERIGDIQFWKTEINHETDSMLTETGALCEAKRILEKALQETENPLHISQECLYHREKRQGIDLVHDNPEKELIRVSNSRKIHLYNDMKYENLTNTRNTKHESIMFALLVLCICTHFQNYKAMLYEVLGGTHRVMVVTVKSEILTTRQGESWTRHLFLVLTIFLQTNKNNAPVGLVTF